MNTPTLPPTAAALSGRHVLVGITGGIAAYKSADLVRRLREAGAQVRVAMTEAAIAFVSPLTFQALSGAPVRHTLIDAEAEAGMGHIELARWADAILVAPASADFMARLAGGLADDLLSTLCLASEAPLCLAPAMNRVMWKHPATQDNAQRLAARGVHLFGPASGAQACGETGAGRMLEPMQLVDALGQVFASERLAGRQVLITAGPTREALDPVRYISNRSSGRMGYAVAEAARAAGARVVLVSGPTALPAPAGVERIRVESAQQMHRAVFERVASCEIFIATAAVADYRPAHPAEQKIKKHADRLSIELIRNPDILAEVAALPKGPFTVGFAAETEELERHAREKRKRKGVDLIAANQVGNGLGFDREDNALVVYGEHDVWDLGTADKRELARRLIERIADALEKRGTAP